ncbi:MAG TPA: hypothetical protein VGN63_19540 [Flavisolibacter sp.]|jgi:hypothetical protein|nr:hypothetical protein [Flavisolibacter sp.]
MKQDQRKQLIQAMVNGDISSLQDLHEEANRNSIPADDFLPTAYYLLENGEPEITRELPGYVDYYNADPEDIISTQEDIECILEGIRAFAKTGDYKGVSLKALKHFLQIFQCYFILRNEGQLDQLDKYRHLVDETQIL